MKITFTSIIAILLAATTFTSCSDSESYSELLTEESHAVNYFLSDYRVEAEIPADSIFEYGENAPFYRLNEDGTLYMQVVNPGTSDNKVKDDELIYFRFTRYSLTHFYNYGEMVGTGNADDFLTVGSTSFRFGNTMLSSASSYGMGVQEPLKFLGVDCEVNLVIKSSLGPSNEIAYVTPYLYTLRYFRSPY